MRWRGRILRAQNDTNDLLTNRFRVNKRGQVGERNFQKLWKLWQGAGKWLCIGLDTDVSRLPKGQDQISFNRAIVEATRDLVCAYKLNSAFYESQGAKGWEALKKTNAFIHEQAPKALVILDGKRGDIGNTSAQYARAAFETLGADAVTLNPYMGRDSLQPFLDYKDKGCFVLCRTSNPSAKEFQDLLVEGEPLYLRVARKAAGEWNKNKNAGLVVGATGPEEFQKVRAVAPDLPILVPGVGAQGGELKKILLPGVIVNVSRAILFASSGADFAEAARREAERMSENRK